MAVTQDIFTSWRRPRVVVRKLLAQGQRDDRALVFLMLGCALICLSQLPSIVRSVEFGQGEPFEAQLGGVIMAWLFIAPLVLYGIAAASHILARLFRGRGAFHSARLALFWSLFAASPLWLLAGLSEGYFGAQAAATMALGLIAFVLFIYQWFAGLYEAEWGQREVSE